jgi:hypothetical protein
MDVAAKLTLVCSIMTPLAVQGSEMLNRNGSQHVQGEFGVNARRLMDTEQAEAMKGSLRKSGSNRKLASASGETSAVLTAYISSLASADGDVLELTTGTFQPGSTQSGTMPSGLVITKGISIQCEDSTNTCTLDGSDDKRLISIEVGASSPLVTLVGLVVTKGYVDSKGGGVYVEGPSTAQMTSCDFTDNNAEYGSAIHLLSSATLTLTECSFENNGEAVMGGAIYVYSSTLNLLSCDFDGHDSVSTRVPGDWTKKLWSI